MNQPPLNQDALARHQWAHDFNSCDCGKSIPTIIDSENCVYVPNDKAMAMHQIEMATVAQPVVNSAEELAKAWHAGFCKGEQTAFRERPVNPDTINPYKNGETP